MASARSLGIAVVGVAALASDAYGGHESPFYPSFYPQEIRIEKIDAAAAIAGWPTARVHAYLNADLFAGRKPPADSSAADSLRGFLVLTFDATAGAYAIDKSDPRTRCAVAKSALRALKPGPDDYIAYPYPVTPYHADYLQQFDLVDEARRSTNESPAAERGGALRIRARGALAEQLVPQANRGSDAEWDATLEEVPLESLVDISATGPGGFIDSPWMKQGWLQAYRLYARDVGDPAHAVAVTYRRLLTGGYRDVVERMNLERKLIGALASRCERVVAGYTLRREYVDTEYSNGVENVGFDSQTGLTSAIFARTAKLKDFPWNGWLRVGTETPTDAAWNPIGGFSDPGGRALWLALSDPALIPAPRGGSFVANRVTIVASQRGTLPIPSDALVPEPGSGALRSVGSGKTAQQRLRLAVGTSAFHDGTSTGLADIVYPYIFASRFAGGLNEGARETDRAVAARIVHIRDALAGFKRVGEKTDVLDFGDDLKFRHHSIIVDLYLKQSSTDASEAAAMAPPWSTLPWEAIVLMEEAVGRGYAAYSQPEAKRRGIAWLDLVRDPDLARRLDALVEEFQKTGYRPQALQRLVTADDARARWSALAKFRADHGHFLVTNGPYLLHVAPNTGPVLQVFRDLTYPKGVGAFDAYAIPLEAYVKTVTDRGEAIEITAEVERIARSQRSYEIERVAYTEDVEHSDETDRPECRYVVFDGKGRVVRAGSVGPGHDAKFAIGLSGLAPPGLYKVAVALYVQGNAVNPEIRVIEHRAAGLAGTKRGPGSQDRIPNSPH